MYKRQAFAYVAAIFVYIVVTALADTGTVFSDMPGAVQREVVPWLYGLRYTALLFMNLLPLGCLYNNFDMYVALRLARRVTIVATILQMMVILVTCASCSRAPTATRRSTTRSSGGTTSRSSSRGS